MNKNTPLFIPAIFFISDGAVQRDGRHLLLIDSPENAVQCPFL